MTRGSLITLCLAVTSLSGAFSMDRGREQAALLHRRISHSESEGQFREFARSFQPLRDGQGEVAHPAIEEASLTPSAAPISVEELEDILSPYELVSATEAQDLLERLTDDLLRIASTGFTPFDARYLDALFVPSSDVHPEPGWASLIPIASLSAAERHGADEAQESGQGSEEGGQKQDYEVATDVRLQRQGRWRVIQD